ncbi:MAG: ABC transporter ATP-binding protein [Lentisphaerales bacterium]|nr:ABC transporter ATP-binding protein [Lentisphaerales bacterium]
MKPVIQIENVCKTYFMGENQVQALNDVSMDFGEGEFWALLGPSGSGKSTLLNMIGCLDSPTSGRCLIDGIDVSTMNDNQLSDLRLSRLGFIFQSFNLIQQLTVAENIALPLFYQGCDDKKSKQRAKELAAMVELDNRTGHLPKELSGGQQQRVAIARALANDPSIILADEPTGALDTKTGEQIMAMLTDLNKIGITIIMVTHEPEVADFASHKLHMRDGVIAKIERPECITNL